MSITINLEIGHDASLRTKTTPEGFTHDWEVYVKGCNGAEIHYYVEKVVFHLHETFPKPKRVVKEPPYSLRTSGYAGFNLPIEIYLRNNQEPKKIKFNYDLQLQPRGPPIHNVQKEKYVFHAPSEEFRSKLLKGGGIIGLTGLAQELNDCKSVDDKSQMTSKPKLSGAEAPKKHKIKLDEPRNTDFLNLFGTPITKTTSKAPEPPKPKEVPKSFPKMDKPVDKDKSKTKSPHKDKDKDKPKDKDKSSDGSDKKKEEKKKSKEDKNKDRDRAKERSSKKDKEREKSPSSRPRSASPKRSPKRPPSPPPPKHSSKEKEQSKEERKDKERKDEKKNKKEKREHKESKHKDRDKEKEHKEHKNRDGKSGKELSVPGSKEKEVSPAPVNIAVPQNQQKNDKKDKSKESLKDPKDDEKPRSDKSEKHKHKKKDRKEKREDKYSSKSEKKSEKQPVAPVPVKEEPREPPPVSSSRDADKSNLFGSPKSEPPSTPSQTEPKEKLTNMSFKDEEISNDSIKASSGESSPPHRPLEPPPEPVKTVEPEKKREESAKKKEKREKKKDKKSDKDHERKRKRKSPQAHVEPEQPPEKVLKEEENNNSDDERKVSSTEDANPLPRNEAEDYMGMLRDLQHKIMGLKDNSDLQKVVQLIAETGRYEVSAHTFDFDLCLLDRSTVRQLQDFFASIS